MKKFIALTTVLFLLISNSFCQLQIDWQQCYGGSENEEAVDILKNAEGNIVFGSTHSTDGQVSNNYGGNDYWIVQTDSMGNVIWDKNYGGSKSDFLWDAFYAANSTGFYLVGNSASTDHDISYDPYNGKGNIWVVRCDIEGNIIWDRKVGSPIGLAYDQFGSPTEDGGVILSAQIDCIGGDISVYYGGYDGWVIKLDSTGKTEWDFTMGTPDFEFINGAHQTGDGGYIALISGKPDGTAGNIDCQSHNGSVDAILYKIDPDGNGVWDRCYGGSNSDDFVDLLETDSGYMVTGYTRSSDGDLEGAGYHGRADVWVMKTDFAGNMIWSRCYGGTQDESPQAVFETSEGDFVIFANTHSFDGDVVDNPSNSTVRSSIWVIKINGDGDLLWQQCIGSHADDAVYGVSRYGDNEYAVAGLMTFSPSGDVNCSNFVYGSQGNYWAFGLTDITVDIPGSSASPFAAVYPNPAGSSFNVQLPQEMTARNTIIQLIDLNGRILMERKPVSVVSHFEINLLKSGLYLVRIQNNDQLIMKKLIVR